MKSPVKENSHDKITPDSGQGAIYFSEKLEAILHKGGRKQRTIPAEGIFAQGEQQADEKRELPRECRANSSSPEIDPQVNFDQLKVFYLTGERPETNAQPKTVEKLLPALLFSQTQDQFKDVSGTGEPVEPIRLLQAVAIKVWQKNIAAFGEELRTLISTLNDWLQAFQKQAKKTTPEENLQSALGDPAGKEMDSKAFSDLLTESGFSGSMTNQRAERIAQALEILRSMEPFYIFDAETVPVDDMPQSSPLSFITNAANSIESLKQRYERFWEQQLAFFKAVKIARLEAAYRYHEEIHDTFFAKYNWDFLSSRELALVPPVLLHLSATHLKAEEYGTLIELLSSDHPIKILFQVDDIYKDVPGRHITPATFNSWAMQLGGIAANLGSAFVLQTPFFNIDMMLDGFFQGVNTPGPALFSLYTAASNDVRHPAPLPIDVAAMEARIFPAFTYNPLAGEDLAARFDVRPTPQCDKIWPESELNYMAGEQQTMRLTLPFTAADILLMEPRFSDHFWVLPRERWHERLLPLNEFLTLVEDRRRDRFPYILAVDQSGVMWRVLPNRQIIKAAEKITSHWKMLQELGGVNNSHARRALEEERARLQENMEKKIAEIKTRYEAQASLDTQKIKAQAVSNILGGLLGQEQAGNEIKS